MRTWTVRLGLSLMVVVGLWTNRTPAQEPLSTLPAPLPVNITPTPAYFGPTEEVFIVPTVPFVPEFHPPDPPIILPPPPPAKHLVVRVLNHFGMGCESDSFGCTGSFYSELRWCFGSSRSFFGDRCCPCGQGRACADGRNP